MGLAEFAALSLCIFSHVMTWTCVAFLVQDKQVLDENNAHDIWVCGLVPLIYLPGILMIGVLIFGARHPFGLQLFNVVFGNVPIVIYMTVTIFAPHPLLDQNVGVLNVNLYKWEIAYLGLAVCSTCYFFCAVACGFRGPGKDRGYSDYELQMALRNHAESPLHYHRPGEEDKRTLSPLHMV
jgi:hypothetical protein